MLVVREGPHEELQRFFIVLLQSSGEHIPTTVVLDLSQLSFIFYSVLPFGSSVSSLLSAFSSLYLSCTFLKIQKPDNLIFVYMQSTGSESSD